MFSNFFKTKLFQLLLFLATLFSTSLAGSEWMGIYKGNFWQTLLHGLWFSIPFIGILTFHEFGHYFAAKYYKLKVTLPYYIPLYFPSVPSIGTMGAFIRIKSMMPSKKVVFDVGIAGPIAGFVVALGVLYYGFTHLPSSDYIYQIHPEYEFYGVDYEKEVYTYQHFRTADSLKSIKMGEKFVPKEKYEILATGSNLLFYIFEHYVASPQSWIPNRYELFHYPFLFAGYLALFFTALNLIPIGQLDGGHILYGLIGSRRQRQVVPYLFGIFVYLGTIDFLKEIFYLKPMQSFDDMLIFAPFYLLFLTLTFSSVTDSFRTKLMISVLIFSSQFFTLYIFSSFNGFGGWWVFAFILGRFLGVYHPVSPDETPLNWKRKLLGWVSLLIFILSFTPEPITIEYISR